MSERQRQVVNLFKAIRKLYRGCTIRQLAFALDVSEKTAYRYKDTLIEIGFRFYADKHTRQYKIVDKMPMDINLAFSQEEVEFILGFLPEEEELSKAIQNKLYIHSDLREVPRSLDEIEFGRSVKGLQKAMQNKKRVILKDYSSANSNECRHIVVEPLKLEDQYRRLYAFTPERKKLMQFKTERIGEVEILPESQFYSNLHPKKIETDSFWWVFDGGRHEISMDVSLGVYHMLREEYPRIERDVIKVDKNCFRLETEVADYTAPSSVVLRYPEGIFDLAPEPFKAYTINRLRGVPLWKDIPRYMVDQ